jgi:S1-C subfamily serine protease
VNTIDVVAVLMMVVYGFAGWRSGFFAGILEVVGLIAGGGLGLYLAPRVHLGASGSLTATLVPLFIVVSLAALGQGFGRWASHGIQPKNRMLRKVNATGGLALGMATAVMAVWVVGFAATATNLPWLASAAQQSVILTRLNSLMPTALTQAMVGFTKTINGGVLPSQVESSHPTLADSTQTPDPAILAAAGVQNAAASVVKITGATDCGKGLEGSGFVYANERVMTNAHVLAGVTSPSVALNGRVFRATTVLFDPSLDLAILKVPSLRAPLLKLDETGEQGQSAAVLGFPENGPYTATEARIRSVIQLKSQDIYGKGEVTRETFAIRGNVRSGNSGGPLVSAQGAVLGVVFAASTTESETGFALTAEAVRSDAVTGQSANQPVGTGSCTSS